ncbi:MAG: shikimate dehydrogenase [Rhodobacteraceae bacterium]|nr:shikimate dehydrogenase [Paracoccaceae bacterium]
MKSPMTLRVGLIGRGIGQSRTPRMHVEEGRANGLSYRYDLIDTTRNAVSLKTVLDHVESEGFRGVNITHPYKQAVLPFLDTLSNSAQAVGAVNTVIFEEGCRFGHNTDYWGFAEAFRQSLAGVLCCDVLLLGAGGAGGAVAHGLLDCGVERLWIFDAKPQAALRLADHISQVRGEGRAQVTADPTLVLTRVQGIVNATPMGMASHPGSPLPTDALSTEHWVADIVYFPSETAFLKAAGGRGCQVMNGSGMAVFQAVRAFELFTGIEPDSDRMKATFDEFA